MLHDRRCVLRLEALPLRLTALKHDHLASTVLVKVHLVVESASQTEASVVKGHIYVIACRKILIKRCIELLIVDEVHVVAAAAHEYGIIGIDTVGSCGDPTACNFQLGLLVCSGGQCTPRPSSNPALTVVV